MGHDIPTISVLLVEDEPMLLTMAAEILKDAGFTVFEACNAGAAQDVMAAHDDITILFTDIEMPGPMNGLALAHHARKHSTARKIIVTSGRREVSPSELPSEAIFLPKPYRMGDIIRTVKSLSA